MAITKFTLNVPSIGYRQTIELKVLKPVIKWKNKDNEEIGKKTIKVGDNNDNIKNYEYSNICYGEPVKLCVENINQKIENIHIRLVDNTKIELENIKFKEVDGGGVESDYFIIPLDKYNESLEEYSYDKHITYVKEVDINSVMAVIDDKKYDKDEYTLTPYTYRRNYEELIGLYKYGGTGNKELKNNYEVHFTNQNFLIETLVNKFIKFITDTDLSYGNIKDRVEKDAKKLWKIAVDQVKNRNYDDRPLYWARNRMQVYMKRHPVFKDDIDFDKSVVKNRTNLEKIIKLFEEKSRNYTGIDFDVPEAIGRKKILITGFDPFQLNPDPNFISFMGFDSAKTFNPSGIVALFFNENKDVLNQNIFVQTCIFPVRYEDFDDGCVEKVISKHINEVDVVMTTSLNGSHDWFDIEADAIEYRGGFHDNMCIGGQDYSQFNYNMSRFIPNTSHQHNLTTLPKAKIFGNNTSININKLTIKFDDSKLNSLTEGGGSNYLSNEIMFRATKIRGNSTKPVGHFHLANLKTITRIEEIIDVTKEIINKIIK